MFRMQQFSEFLANHPILFAALVLVIVAIAVNEFLLIRRGGKRIPPSEAVRLINDRDARIIDLRAAADFKRGHIVESVNVPMARLNDEISALKKHPERPVILVCALGSTAAQAGLRLRQAGLTEVYPVSGGINAWQNAGLPLTTK